MVKLPATMTTPSCTLHHLESESVEILREAVAGARKPVMMYSIGKDSSVMLHLARKAKRLIARRPDGARPRLYRYSDEGEEARGAAAWVRAMHEENGLEYRRIAVFYRTNAMSRAVEEALVQAAIPYQIVKGVEFFHRREIKDVLAYLRLLINPADEVSLLGSSTGRRAALAIPPSRRSRPRPARWGKTSAPSCSMTLLCPG